MFEVKDMHFWSLSDPCDPLKEGQLSYIKVIRQGKAMLPILEFSSYPQCQLKAVVGISSSKMYLGSGYFLAYPYFIYIFFVFNFR